MFGLALAGPLLELGVGVAAVMAALNHSGHAVSQVYLGSLLHYPKLVMDKEAAFTQSVHSQR